VEQPALNEIKILHRDPVEQAARDIRVRCDTSHDRPMRALHIRDSPDFPRRKTRRAKPSRQLPRGRRDAPLWRVLLPACL